MNPVYRYVRLYGCFLRFSFSKAFEFRFDFYMRILMDLCYYAVAIAFFKIIYIHTNALGGWNEAQIMVFVSGYLIVDAVNMTMFSNNMWAMPMLINKGDLDYYLVRPVSSLFFVCLREFAANSFINLVCALSIFIWALSGLHPQPQLHIIFLYLLMLLNGSVIFFCLNAISNLVVFWTHSSSGFGELVWSMSKLSERPDRIYQGFTRKVLTLVLPYAIISSFPARIILDGPSWDLMLNMLGVSSLFLLILILLWNHGLKSYSSASS